MKQNRFLMFCSIAVILPAIHSVSGQVTNGTVRTAAPRVTTTRSAPAPKSLGITKPAVAPRVLPRPAISNPRILNSSAPRIGVQPAVIPQRKYSPPMRPSNSKVTVINTQPATPAQRAITIDPAIRQTELRTLAAMHQRRGIVTREGNILDPPAQRNGIQKLTTTHEKRGLVPGQANTLDAATRNTELRTIEAMHERRVLGTQNQTLATIDPQRHAKNPAPEAGPQREKPEGPKGSRGKKWHNKKDRIGYDEAFRRHWHESHDRNWWHDHCDTVVFVTTGYYFLDGSYWYPAWGYDPLQSYYDYDGPIYTYGDLLPDEVISNVQTALQYAGYYFGAITGSLSIDTRAALANFQRDYGLQVTGAIDEATVEALGLYDAGDTSDFQIGEVY
jgi:hypothetical protein